MADPNMGESPATHESPDADHQAIGVWLRLLSAWLGVWQPLNMAAAAAEGLGALAVRGWPLAALLVLRGLVAAFGVAGALAVWRQRPGALAVARLAVGLSLAAQLFVLATSIAPNNRAPGDTPLHVAGAVAVHGGWLIYLARSARARRLLA